VAVRRRVKPPVDRASQRFRRVSLRVRLALAIVLLVGCGLLISDVVTYRYLRGFLMDRLDQQLASAASQKDLLFGGHRGPDDQQTYFGPEGSWAQVVTGQGVVLAAAKVIGSRQFDIPTVPVQLAVDAMQSSLGTSRFDTESSTNGFGPYRVLVTTFVTGPGSVAVLEVGIPLSDVRTTLDRLLAIELIVSALIMLAAGGGAWYLVRIGLRPLDDIAETAGAIAAGDLSQRVEVESDRTEVGRLGVALNSMLGQIEAAFDERRRSEERLRRFLADASHELRTPLTSIRGYSELFRLGAADRPEDLEKAMRRIEQEAARMGILVDDMLLLARLEEGRPLDLQPVELEHLVTDAVDDARAVEPDRPIELVVGDDPLVLADEGRLRQVVGNLLGNVRVHTPAGAPARVTLGSEHGHAVITVSDSGPGIDAESMARVFERFYRADPSRTRASGGAGLGLAIAASIVAAHSGHITVSSPPDGGAMFRIELPLAPTGDEEPQGQPTPLQRWV
jgi:two-component system OmpR family sensor kinase